MYMSPPRSQQQLPNLLEPVDEVADEEANYFSKSPQDRSAVSIVDPEVQLFNDNNEVNGGEEQSDLHSNDSIIESENEGQGAVEEETKKQPGGQQSIDQLYGQISMFDQITEENYYGRGEQSDQSDEGEDATKNIKKFRQQIEHLNSDLHDLIYSGEEDDEGEDGIDSLTQRSGAKAKKMHFKKSGKPQNLDLLPSNYIEENQNSSDTHPMPAHMIKEVVQVLDDDTYIV